MALAEPWEAWNMCHEKNELFSFVKFIFTKVHARLSIIAESSPSTSSQRSRKTRSDASTQTRVIAESLYDKRNFAWAGSSHVVA